jgi:membrane-bound acyltransferase YfiQ involved in biofilm formation
MQSPALARERSAPKADHLFVNNARFCSIVAVVLLHCALEERWLTLDGTSPALCRLLIAFLKFGTINFFFVSGFLAGERLDHQDSLQYLKRRIQNVGMPWLLWASVWFAVVVLHDVLQNTFLVQLHQGLGAAASHYAFESVVKTAFWFVPNLIFALAILLFMRHWFSERVTGTILLACSLFYGINVYRQWVPSLHMEAFCGFIFYIWLGACAARHLQAVERWLARVPMPWILCAGALTLAAAIQESNILAQLGAPDSNNTLRITNQLYSLVVVAFMLKLRVKLSPRFIPVRETTFGIYLTHTLALRIVSTSWKITVPHLRLAASIYRFLATDLGYLSLVIALFAATYGLSLAMVKWIIQSDWYRRLLPQSIGTTAPSASRPVPSVSVETMTTS